MNILNAPDKFMPRHNHIYPPHNNQIFENYFYDYCKNNYIESERIYVPVLWTNFYIERNYGSADMSDLQDFIDGLDKSKKYFTVLQYDDGILQDLKDLDIKVFGAGGGGQRIVPDKNIGYPIPQINQPAPNTNKYRDRDILCSFVGTIRGRHKIREKIKSLYSNKLLFDRNLMSMLINFVIGNPKVKENMYIDKFFISESIGYSQFQDVMERSVFSLCPRGYGATSFRICESLQHGSIPIYVYDKDWTPWYDEFDFNLIGIKVH